MGNEIENVEFLIDDIDQDLVDRALQTARELLKKDGLDEFDRRGLKNAIQAVERLPATSPGVNIAFGAVKDMTPNQEVKSGFRYLLFSITEESFGITSGGMVDYGHGLDSFLSEGYVVGLHGFAQRDYLAKTAQENISHYLVSGGSIEVDDQSSYTW